MRRGIGAIGAEAGGAASATTRAVEAATTTSSVVQRLSDSTERIGHVIELINSIAHQTDLLALNATIGLPGRASGQGLRVVAGEVKELANQTGGATGEIRAQIDAIQADTCGSCRPSPRSRPWWPPSTTPRRRSPPSSTARST